MKTGLKTRRPDKFSMRATVRRSDLLSLIREMESNPRLQCASWQIESLRESLRVIEAGLSRIRPIASLGSAPLSPRAPARRAGNKKQVFGLI